MLIIIIQFETAVTAVTNLWIIGTKESFWSIIREASIFFKEESFGYSHKLFKQLFFVVLSKKIIRERWKEVLEVWMALNENEIISTQIMRAREQNLHEEIFQFIFFTRI